jgi:hypothetical protein
MSSSISNSKKKRGAHLRTVLGALGIALPAILILWARVPGNREPYYVRFTTPRRPSLILGTSRGAQGLVPSELEFVFGNRIAEPILNFSFTASHSRWGPSYYDAFMQKLKRVEKPGLFILEVSPISLVIDKMQHRTFGAQYSTNDREDLLPEANKGLLNCLNFFNLNPNLDYVRCRHSRSLYSLLYTPLKDRDPAYHLHEDGWLEVSLDKLSTPATREERAVKHRELLESTRWSQVREDWLRKSVRELNRFGRVFLVRLPTDKNIADVEHSEYPEFDKKMEDIAQSEGARYINYMEISLPVTTTDGSHLYRESSRRVSADLAHRILNFMNENK